MSTAGRSSRNTYTRPFSSSKSLDFGLSAAETLRKHTIDGQLDDVFQPEGLILLTAMIKHLWFSDHSILAIGFDMVSAKTVDAKNLIRSFNWVVQ
jgi:hypothetical protein